MQFNGKYSQVDIIIEMHYLMKNLAKVCQRVDQQLGPDLLCCVSSVRPGRYI